MMSQSSMQSTGFGLDVSITGEGFLQVMDADGNIYYTRAGMLDYDANGYLVDINGNFVLGSVDVNGAPGTQRIKLDNAGDVPPTASWAEQVIQGVKYVMSASRATKDGNVGFTISAAELPIGQMAEATITSTGSILVRLNENAVFTSLAQLNDEINRAIIMANGNKEHVAGTFTLTMEDVDGGDASNRFAGAFNPAEFGGVFDLETDPDFRAIPKFLGGARITGVSSDFPVSGPMTFAVSDYTAGPPDSFTLTMTVGTGAGAKVYEAIVEDNGLPVILQSWDRTDILNPFVVTSDGSITVSMPTFTEMLDHYNNDVTTPPLPGAPYTMASLFADLMSSVLDINDHHSYAVKSASGRFGLTGGQIAIGNFNVTPGRVTGFPAAGFGFVETSNNFEGNGSVSSFELVYDAPDGGIPGWTVRMVVDDGVGNVKVYEGRVAEDAVGSSLLLKNTAPPQDSITLSIPTFNQMSELFSNEFRNPLNNPLDPHATGSVDPDGVIGDGSTLDLTRIVTRTPYPNYPSGRPPTGNQVQPAIPAVNLGLGTVSFNLSKGTEGGLITLDQLTGISIGADGTVSVSHADKGIMSVGKVSLANFSNPRGLQQAGTNYYTETVNSGAPVLTDPGTGGTGNLKASTLEMSNVDLAQEFADMIVTQRGFQANTRIISVSDQMLEELVNLKR